MPNALLALVKTPAPAMVSLCKASTVQVLPTDYSLLVIDSAPQLSKCPVMGNVHLYLSTKRGTQGSRHLMIAGSTRHRLTWSMLSLCGTA